MDERLERVYARWCARSVLHLWDAPEVVRRWVDEGEEDLRDAAANAANAAWIRDRGGDASWAACWAAEQEIIKDAAAQSARAAVYERALESYPGPQGRSTVGMVAAQNAKRDERRAQQAACALIALLPDLLRSHGIAARLLDDVRADPWLTREVVRALGLPDLAAWCDWCKQMEDDR